jgi:hypothetical protein
MKQAKVWAVTCALVLAGTAVMAAGKQQDRKRAKDGSGDNCTLNAPVVLVVDAVNGNGTCTKQRKQSKDGSCGTCTAE